MPEDCLIIDFKPSDDTKTKSLAEQLADDIVQRSIMEYFDKDTRDTAPVADMSQPDWDGNVPPDFTDSFDFLL